MEDIDPKRMRKELLNLYEDFLKDPDSKETKDRAIAYDRKYGGLAAYENITSKQPLPEDIMKALKGIPDIFQYGSGLRDDKETITYAKDTVQDLKKDRPTQ